MNFDPKYVVAYYLSNYGHDKIYPNLKQYTAIEKMADILKVNKNGLKNIRDFFDANYRDIPRDAILERKKLGRRVGWYQAPLPDSYVEVKEYYDRKNEEEVRADVLKILNLTRVDNDSIAKIQIHAVSDVTKHFIQEQDEYIYKPDGINIINIEYNDTGENRTYDYLFTYFIENAGDIKYFDRYVHKKYQINNLKEFMETIIKARKDTKTSFYLETTEAPDKKWQISLLDQIKKLAKDHDIEFSYHFVRPDNNNHEREILTDEWEIFLDKGLDIYQEYNIERMYIQPQKQRKCIKTHISYKRREIK